MDIHNLLDTEDATGLAEWLRRGELQPGELLEAVIDRIELVEPQLNAVAERLYDSAREAARTLQPGAGVFAGVPTLIKDLFSPVNGVAMTNGSQALGGFRADFDAELVTRLRRAGCVIAGTSTSPEFGTSYSTESNRFGATRNPWNISHSAGGSSGGAAALVAARVVPFAHGNDGGGSLRVPASCCGVFGLKPSRGLLPSGPMIGEGWAGMGTPHAITLSVRDSAALLDATAGIDLGAPYAAPLQAQPYVSALQRDPRPLRIALVEQLGPWATSSEAVESVRAAARLCESLGHRVESVSSAGGAAGVSRSGVYHHWRQHPSLPRRIGPDARLCGAARGAGGAYADHLAQQGRGQWCAVRRRGGVDPCVGPATGGVHAELRLDPHADPGPCAGTDR